jgi:RNA polymerase sigma factor (sigma-70 family)
MSHGPTGVALAKHLRTLYDVGAVGGLTDGQLLERFLAGGGDAAEAAFAALVERHGPMILRVCRATLRDPHDAEDASQAAFLVLARRARAIKKRDSVGSWLFGVAGRVAARAKADAARRRRHERRGAEMAARRASAADRAEAWADLYEELGRLPEAYRAPIVLCDLEGHTHEQAARLLRGTVRTIQRRLERGRRRLRERLARRGVTASAGLLGAAATPGMARAAVPASWAESTVRAATHFAAGPAATATAGSVPAPVAALAEGVLRTMLVNKLKMTAAALLASGAVVAGAGVLAQQGSRDAPPSAPGRLQSRPAAPAEKPRELVRDDGQPAGKRSIAGGGHAVRFEAPGDGWSLVSVRLHGARYGYPQPPKEDFKVYVCDADFKPIAEFPFPYSTYERGKAAWKTLDVKPIKVPKTFIVCVGFDPTQTKGVFVSHDKEGSGSSLVGLPGDESQPFPKGDWLIRARVAPPAAAAAPKPR